MTLIRRSFFHYNSTWYHCLINPNKLFPLTNEVHKTFREFIYGVIVAKNVPNQYFSEDADRCCTTDGLNCHVLKRPSRYKTIVENALANRGDLERHYVVQKALVENPLTDFVVSELPVWLPDGKRVGHIDLVELAEGNPSLVVWDYKPHVEEEDASGQISMYAMILAQMLNVPLKEIQCGYFNETVEVLIVE